MDTTTHSSGQKRNETADGQRVAGAAGLGSGTAARQWWRQQRIVLPVTAVMSFLVGVCSGGAPAETAATEAVALRGQITQREDELAAMQERAERAERAADEARSALARRLTESSSEASGSGAPPAADAAVGTPQPVTPVAPAAAAPAPVPAPPRSSESDCAAGYSPCIPSYPPDLDCPDIGHPVTVTGSDPHRLDRDDDGVGCES